MTSNKRFAYLEAPSAWSSNPMPPCKSEALRVELTRKQEAAASFATQRLSMYATRSQPRGSPLDHTRLAQDPAVQDAAAPVGTRAPLPATRADAGLANVNALRFKRTQNFAQALPMDGGRTASPTNLQYNWVEDKRDPSYKSEWHIKELQLNKLWDTDYTANFVNTHSREYAAGTFKRNAVAVPPAPQDPGVPRTPKESDGRYVYYAQQGFGTGQQQDHTVEPARGGHWLGIAADSPQESVTTTVHGRRGKLAFQQRTPTDDPRAKLLAHSDGGHGRKDYWTLRAYNDLDKSQRYTSTWRSTYCHDYTDHIRTAGGTGAGGTAVQSNRSSWVAHRQPYVTAVRPVTAAAATAAGCTASGATAVIASVPPRPLTSLA